MQAAAKSIVCSARASLALPSAIRPKSAERPQRLPSCVGHSRFCGEVLVSVSCLHSLSARILLSNNSNIQPNAVVEYHGGVFFCIFTAPKSLRQVWQA